MTRLSPFIHYPISTGTFLGEPSRAGIVRSYDASESLPLSSRSPRPGIRPKGCAAFTLVELLVVTVILLVLVGLAIPALNSARMAVNRTKCASNLHGIGVAIQEYASDNDNTLPGPCYMTATTAEGPPNPTQNQYVLGQCLAPYFGRVFKNYTGAFSSLSLFPEFACPTMPAAIWRSKQAQSYSLVWLAIHNAAYWPFGYPSTTAGKAPLRLAALAALTPLDTTPALQELDLASPTSGAFPLGTYNWALDSDYYYLPAPRHKTRNTLYFDWHVEAH